MYNRYIRNDEGVYQRIPVQEEPQQGQPFSGEPGRQEASQYTEPQGQPWGDFPPPPKGGGKKQGFLSSLLGKLKLDEIDTGDLLLLVILFLLFKDGEDEELLIALGLLLIL